MADAKLPFANDGSFFEQFKKLQEQQASAPQETAQEPGAGAPAEQATTPLNSSAADGVPKAPESRPSSSQGEQGEPDGGSARFLPSSTFTGARAGYVFKAGDEGVGYYVDEPLHLRPREQAKAKPVVLKTNNPIVKGLAARKAVAQPDSKKRKLGEAGSSAHFCMQHANPWGSVTLTATC